MRIADIRPGQFAGRLLHRRREVPLTDAQRLSAAMMTAPVAAAEGLHSAAETIRQAGDAAGESQSAVAVKTGQRPDPGSAAAQLAAYRHAANSERRGPRPSYHPAKGAAPKTAPLDVLSAGALDGDADGMTPLEKVANGLRHLNWDALEAARASERETYARTTGAPFHNTLLKEWRTPLGDPARPAWRPPARRVRRHYAAVARRAGDVRDLTYPAITGFTAPGADDMYAELLRRVSVITGTTGIGNWLPEPAMGGAA
jgi:hypothetical protein